MFIHEVVRIHQHAEFQVIPYIWSLEIAPKPELVLFYQVNMPPKSV